MTSLPSPSSPEAAAALLRWYQDSGVTTAESDSPSLYAEWPTAMMPARPAPQQRQTDRPSVTTPAIADDGPMPADEAIALAKATAAACSSLEELVQAIQSFDGCNLKGGARNTVVFDGVLGAPVLVLGEAPGRDEDRVGKPFVGKAGGLLDKMLAAINLSRIKGDECADVCITNTIYWRPPGNRNPTKTEIATCRPFFERFIALSKPRCVLMTGNVPTQALFADAPGITRSRGAWREIALDGVAPIPALPIFHPAYLLRQPAMKRMAWTDLLAMKARLAQD